MKETKFYLLTTFWQIRLSADMCCVYCNILIFRVSAWILSDGGLQYLSHLIWFCQNSRWIIAYFFILVTCWLSFSRVIQMIYKSSQAGFSRISFLTDGTVIKSKISNCNPWAISEIRVHTSKAELTFYK